MIINLATDYIPEVIIPNEYFFVRYGITNEEIVAKSGIKQRRRTRSDENTNAMAIDAVSVKPNNGGIKMPFGKDVFQYACKYMRLEIERILLKNGILPDQLNFFIPHQANAGITDYVAKTLNLEPKRVLSNIEQFGNTGSASTPIVLSQNWNRFKQNVIIVIAVFGGGYSSGSALLKKF